MSRINEINKQVLASLTGAERIKALLRANGVPTLAAAAKRMREPYPENVSRCINGDRTYHRIRNKLARLIGVSREEIDTMIAQQKAAAE